MLTPDTLSWLLNLELLLILIGAIGARLLQDFSRHDLQTYCRKKGKPDLWTDVLERHDRCVLASETLLSLSFALFVACCVGIAVTETTSNSTMENLIKIKTDDTGHRADGGEIGLAAIWLGILLLSLIVWIPRAITGSFAAPVIFHSWLFWVGLAKIMTPLTVGVVGMRFLAVRLSGRDLSEDEEEEALEDEIRSIVTAGMHEGLLEEDAWEMIEGVMELDDVDVQEIMTPRSEIDAIDVNTNWDDVLDYVVKSGRTRVPVFDGSLDKIVGILYAKDLLSSLATSPKNGKRELSSLVREAWFIPTTKIVDDLLREFQRNRNHIAIVVDEYNSLSGLVTIEDALEEIVGEIIDEHDNELPPEITDSVNGVAEASGRAHIDDINEKLGLEITESDEIDTIGGFVVHQLGYIPAVNEVLTEPSVRITVLQASKRRVERVRIERVSNGSE